MIIPLSYHLQGTNSSPTQLRETVHTSKIKNIDEIGLDIRIPFKEQIIKLSINTEQRKP